MKRLMLAVALTVLSIGAAAASDLKGTTTHDGSFLPLPAASSGNLSGIWVGLSGGMDFANTAVGVYGEFDKEVPFGAGLDGIGSTGFIGEGQIGYDYRVGKIVFGVFGGGNISNTKTTLDAYIGDMEIARAELTRDWGWYAGARIGYAATKDTLVYTGAGFAQADFSLKADSVFGGYESSETFSGYFGEVGIESRISGPLFIKAFGRYTAYDEKDYSGVIVDPEELKTMVGLVFRQ